MKDAKECEEANIRMEEDVKRTIYDNQKKQLVQMSSNVLEAALPQLNASLEGINESQKGNNIKKEELKKKFNKIEECYGKMRDGNNARKDLINLLSGN
jgi:5-methylcytosine-specific restriction endonuclease McrBC GTP-binding regulatory subunit McrB